MQLISNLKETISYVLAPKSKVISEGIYCGDWLDCHLNSTRIPVPEGIRRINYGDNFDLYLPDEDKFAIPTSDKEILQLRRLAPFSVRTILVEDGRIYHRTELRGSLNNWVLDNFLSYVAEQGGFNTVYSNSGKKGLLSLCNESGNLSLSRGAGKHSI